MDINNSKTILQKDDVTRLMECFYKAVGNAIEGSVKWVPRNRGASQTNTNKCKGTSRSLPVWFDKECKRLKSNFRILRKRLKASKTGDGKSSPALYRRMWDARSLYKQQLSVLRVLLKGVNGRN